MCSKVGVLLYRTNKSSFPPRTSPRTVARPTLRNRHQKKCGGKWHTHSVTNRDKPQRMVGLDPPFEILVLGSLTHKSPRCLQVGNKYSDIINGFAFSILAGCLQSCSWARGLLFELVHALGYVIPGSVCEEHIDDLSQFVTNTSRIQLFQERGHSQAGPHPVWQIDALGK